MSASSTGDTDISTLAEGGSGLFKSLKSGLPHSLNFKVEWMMM